ncbi:unnamed protein product [Hermetia illucens]|uniref:EF-hand domain-containing protein n=1 Tax=Hermetia illucens TaxID=343691 RepID=A0A7R8Z4X5_HERIL|nr:EF-hand calcium-binding domain-containing protein 1-like isoform X2 [Hermetia illucens]CAD7093467.1 unnamed protein product [Hermetia illucens]
MNTDLLLKIIDNNPRYRELMRKYSRAAHIEKRNIRNILLVYHRFVTINGGRSMSQKQFIKLYQIYFNIPDVHWAQSIVDHVDPKAKHTISPEGFLKFMNVCLNNSFEDKVMFCFQVYDGHKTGFITRAKLIRTYRNMLYSADWEEVEDLVIDFVDLLIKKMDHDRDGKISFYDYAKAVRMNPGLLEFMGPVIPDRDILVDIFG